MIGYPVYDNGVQLFVTPHDPLENIWADTFEAIFGYTPARVPLGYEWVSDEFTYDPFSSETIRVDYRYLTPVGQSMYEYYYGA